MFQLFHGMGGVRILKFNQMFENKHGNYRARTEWSVKELLPRDDNCVETSSASPETVGGRVLGFSMNILRSFFCCCRVSIWCRFVVAPDFINCNIYGCGVGSNCELPSWSSLRERCKHSKLILIYTIIYRSSDLVIALGVVIYIRA